MNKTCNIQDCVNPVKREQICNVHKQKQKRLDRKALCLARLGGVCVSCGATDKLEFDHVDPSTKQFDISAGYSFGLSLLLQEVDKCQLLCRPCHTDKSMKELQASGRGRLGYRHRKDDSIDPAFIATLDLSEIGIDI